MQVRESREREHKTASNLIMKVLENNKTLAFKVLKYYVRALVVKQIKGL